MKVVDLLAMVDELKPNQYSDEIKTMWLNEIEHKVLDQVLSKYENKDYFEPEHYTFYDRLYRYKQGEDQELDLFLIDEFVDVYITYICAKIDFYNAEYSRYNNAVLLHNQAFEDMAKYYRRKFMPKKRNNIKPF